MFPPTIGHLNMIETARAFSNKVTVFIYTLSSEVIPGNIRYQALRNHYKNDKRIDIIWIEKTIPQEPKEHPQFWKIWKKDLIEHLGKDIDCVFGSEDYIKEIALNLNCEYFMVDKERETIEISGTKCRNNSIKNWNYVIPEMRNYFVKRIAILGPESSGKSVLSRMLANTFDTNYVEEYGREYCNIKPPSEFTSDDFEHIAKTQIIRESDLKYKSNKFLFCDTEVITTQVFHILYKEKRNLELDIMISKSNYDFYILLYPSFKFVQDGTREFESKRLEHYEMIKKELENSNKDFIVINESDLQKKIRICKRTIEEKFIKTI